MCTCRYKIILPPEYGQVTDIMPDDASGLVYFTYQPNDTYCSVDGFGDQFQFEVTEQYGTSAVGMIDITVNCPTPPMAAPELIFNMTPGTSLPIDLGVSLQRLGGGVLCGGCVTIQQFKSAMVCVHGMYQLVMSVDKDICNSRLHARPAIVNQQLSTTGCFLSYSHAQHCYLVYRLADNRYWPFHV